MSNCTTLSTHDVRSCDIADFWSSVVSQVYAPCTRINFGELFSAKAEISEFGLSEISHIISDGIDYERKISHFLSDQKDDIFVSVMLEGQGYFTQFDHQVTQRSGDILIHDSAYSYLYQYPEAYRSLYYRIPRDLLANQSLDIDSLGGTLIPANTPYAKAIKGYLMSTYALVEDDHSNIDLELSLPILTILSSCIGRYLPKQEIADKRQDHINDIKKFMTYHLADESLTLSDIAANHHLSIRSLNRLFAEIGETPMQWLKKQRLMQAYQILTASHTTSVTEVAFQCGFTDVSSFGKAFNKYFGYSPSALKTSSLKNKRTG